MVFPITVLNKLIILFILLALDKYVVMVTVYKGVVFFNQFHNPRPAYWVEPQDDHFHHQNLRCLLYK